MKIEPVIFLLLAALGLTACQSNALPEQRPDDLKIEYKRKGGILPQEEEILIEGKKARYTFTNRGQQNQLEMELGAVALDSIYHRMKLHHLRDLEAHDGFGDQSPTEVGTVLSVAWSDQSHTIENTGTKYLNPGGDELAFGEIVEMIRDRVLEKIPREPVIVWVEWAGDSLSSSALDLEFAGERMITLANKALQAGRDTSFQFQALPGEHRLSFRITPPSGPRTRFTENVARTDSLKYRFDGREIQKLN